MWEVRTEQLRDGAAQLYSFPGTGTVNVIEGWRSDPEFRSFFCKLISECPYQAFTWEARPIGGRVLGRDFEFILAKSRRLEKLKPSPKPFRKHLKVEGETPVVSFSNFSEDAVFVVPCQTSPEMEQYCHLGTFLRSAPESQKQALWQMLGEVVAEQLSVRPLWLSTSKLGVRWLHLRVDTEPKYYRHEAYRDFSD